MSEKRFFGFVEFGAWVRSQVDGVANLLSSKLGVEDTAVNSHLLEGATKAGVIAEAVEAANLGTIASSDIYVSTVDPLPTDGKNGDLWIKHTP